MAVKTLQIRELPAPLDDLLSLFTDEPIGLPQDFDIRADPDEDLIDSPDIKVDQEPSLADLEPITIRFILRDQLGKDWWSLDIQALVDVLDDNFNIGYADMDLIQALRVLEANNAFWKEWDVFNWVCQGLSGNGSDFTGFPILSLSTMAEAMLVADIILRDSSRDESYSEEVLSYIATTCMEHGLWALPYPLNVAQLRLLTLLRRRDLDMPLGRLEAIKAGETSQDGQEGAQKTHYQALRDDVQKMVTEAVRELSTYSRLE